MGVAVAVMLNNWKKKTIVSSDRVNGKENDTIPIFDIVWPSGVHCP